MGDPNYLTVTKAAQRVNRNRRTIERWISDTDLTVVRIGGLRYIAEEQLLRVFRAKLRDNPSRRRHAD